LVSFPLPLQISAGEWKTVPALIFEKHLLQNEIEGMELTQLKITSYHLRSVIIGDKVSSIIAFRGGVGYLEERITIGGSFKPGLC
jgi:hypothetical protein